MHDKITVCFVAWLMLTGCMRNQPIHPPAIAQLDPFISTIELLKQSVCPIVCLAQSQGTNATLESTEGTAFFVSEDGTFVTAAHVIEGITGTRQKPCPLSAIYLPKNGWSNKEITWFSFRPGECVLIHDFDLARCNTIAKITLPFAPVKIEEAEQPDGTQVAFTGFPLNFVLPLTSRGDIAVYTNLDDRLGRTEVVVDRAAWPGASGSPVYLKDGRVIGVVLRRGSGDSSGITIARPIRFLKAILPGQK